MVSATAKFTVTKLKNECRESVRESAAVDQPTIAGKIEVFW